MTTGTNTLDRRVVLALLDRLDPDLRGRCRVDGCRHRRRSRAGARSPAVVAEIPRMRYPAGGR